MFDWIKTTLKKVLPKPVFHFISIVGGRRDFMASFSFIGKMNLNISLRDKLNILIKMYAVSVNVESPHTQEDILNYIQTILSLPLGSKGVVVEAGCGKGSSTAKFSLAADIVGKQLVVFDSFQGVPENVEPHDKSIFGEPVSFKGGHCRGSLEEVKETVSRYGKINSCRFIEGWFEDTMPGFKEPISAIYLDVNLASSTRTCLKYLYPLLEPSGVLYSHDGGLPLVVDVFKDDEFWQKEVGCPKPHIQGLGEKRQVKIIKES